MNIQLLHIIKGKSLTGKIAHNTAYQFAGKLISLSITVLATIIITRMYGKTGYGDFNIMQNFPALFFIIADFGLNAIATREIAKDWSKASSYFSNILSMRLILSVFLILVGLVTMSIFPYSSNLKLGVGLGLLILLTQSIYATTNIIFQVKLKYNYSTIGYIAGSFCVLALVLLLSFFRINIIWVNFSYVLGGLVTLVLNLIFVKKLGVDIKLGLDKKLWVYMFWQTLPLGMMFIFSQLNFKADSIMLSVLNIPQKYGYTNIESVAVYGLAYKIFEVLLVVPTFLMNSVYPVLVVHQQESKEKLLNTFTRTVLVLFSVGILGGLCVYLLAPWIIYTLGGSEFADSVVVLRILAAPIFIFYLTQPLSWLLVTLNSQKYLPYIYLVSAVFNITANYLFIQRYSFYASATITILSEMLILCMLGVFSVRAWKKNYA